MALSTQGDAGGRGQHVVSLTKPVLAPLAAGQRLRSHSQREPLTGHWDYLPQGHGGYAHGHSTVIPHSLDPGSQPGLPGRNHSPMELVCLAAAPGATRQGGNTYRALLQHLAAPGKEPEEAPKS